MMSVGLVPRGDWVFGAAAMKSYFRIVIGNTWLTHWRLNYLEWIPS